MRSFMQLAACMACLGTLAASNAPASSPTAPATAAAPATSATQNPVPPVQIDACKVAYDSNALLAQTGQLQIRYVNVSSRLATMIRFRVSYSNGNGPGELYVRDTGTFAPNVEINHKFKDLQAIVLSPSFSKTSVVCSVDSVRFQDGSMWAAPGTRD